VAVVRRHVIVSGAVQGVGFRYAVLERARARRLGGFVRNLPTGQVQAVFEGDSGAVDALVEYCRRGPRGAMVTEVEVDAEPPTGEAAFTVR